MPLFDLGPKESRRSLYGRDQELDTLVRLIENRRWCVILGPRMVGKTSLAKAGIRQSKVPSVYVNLWGTRGVAGLLDSLTEGLNSNRSLLRRVADALRGIQGVSLLGSGVSFAPQPRPLRTFHEVLSALGRKAGRFVVVLDEVQELAPASGSFLKLLGNVFNTYPNVGFVFTGSRFGLIRTLLSPCANSPLYGRSPVPIELGPFEPMASTEFLRRGFDEYGVSVDPAQISQVVSRSLDGIPGWLTYFGNCVAVRRTEFDAAERITIAEGKKVVASELRHYLEGRDVATHWAALRALCVPLSWSEFRDGVSASRKVPLNDNSVRNILRALQESGFVAETAHRYQILDPMVRLFVAESARAPRPGN